jgi:hypothetical protein
VAEDTDSCFTVLTENSGLTTSLRKIHSTRPYGWGKRKEKKERKKEKEPTAHLHRPFAKS